MNKSYFWNETFKRALCRWTMTVKLSVQLAPSVGEPGRWMKRSIAPPVGEWRIQSLSLLGNKAVGEFNSSLNGRLKSLIAPLCGWMKPLIASLLENDSYNSTLCWLSNVLWVKECININLSFVPALLINSQLKPYHLIKQHYWLFHETNMQLMMQNLSVASLGVTVSCMSCFQWIHHHK